MDKNKIIALVDTSPELVGKHDRQGWLNLFSTNAIVQDPVGAGPNCKGKDMRKGKDALGRFYDIFIGPNTIKFDVHQDIVVGNEMVREVSIHTTLPNGAITIVHCFLLYKVVEEGGQLKIEALRAHWNFGKNAMALMKNNGVKGMTGSTVQFSTMIKVQGMKRIMEYMGAMYKGILKKGIKAANAFAAAVNARDEASFTKLFDTGAAIEFPAGSKAITAGDFLKGAGKDVKVEIKNLRSGGWFTSGAADVTMGGSSKHGVVFFEFSPKTKKIINARFFWN
ncbi:MAG: nuclear transport factor 2 family protein [Dehalococcoidia bacterium]|jgi:hypothetical protein